MTFEPEKRARLFFRDMELGEVVEEDSDFPKMFGKFYPAAIVDTPLRRKIQEYIDYSVAADKIMQEEANETWDAFCAENETQFTDFIETDDWYLKYENKIELILIPNFCQDNGIVWRFNFLPDEEDALFAASLCYASHAALFLQLSLF